MFSRFIHVVVCISTFIFLSLNNIPLRGYTVFYLSIHQLMHIWIVSTFWLLWIMLLWTFVYKILCGHMFSFLGVYTNCWVIEYLCLTFWGTARLITKWLYHFTFLPAVFESFSFSTTLAVFLVCLFDDNHLSRYGVICHCSFDLHYLDEYTDDVDHLFICFLATFISSLEKRLLKSFVHF